MKKKRVNVLSNWIWPGKNVYNNMENTHIRYYKDIFFQKKKGFARKNIKEGDWKKRRWTINQRRKNIFGGEINHNRSKMGSRVNYIGRENNAKGHASREWKRERKRGRKNESERDGGNKVKRGEKKWGWMISTSLYHHASLPSSLLPRPSLSLLPFSFTSGRTPPLFMTKG